MKRIICMILALMICMSLAVSAAAATDTFTPSVTVKTEPEIVPVEGDGDIVYDAVIEIADQDPVYITDDCLLLTSVSEANKKGSQLEKLDKDAHKLLLDVYKELDSGKMEIPYADFGLKADKMVIRDLFDASFICAGEAVKTLKGHEGNVNHEEMLEDEKAILEATLDLGIGKKDVVHIFVYAENADGEMEWVETEVKNNGDGTVTVEFTTLGIVAICIEQ